MEGIVRNLGGFSRFLDIAASQFGELINFASVARDCHLPTRTVQSYYEILEDTLIGFRLSPWIKSVRKRMVAHSKFYFFDSGVTNSLNKHLTAPPDPGLKAFKTEFPNTPLHVIADVTDPYNLDDVTILPWKKYLENVKSDKL